MQHTTVFSIIIQTLILLFAATMRYNGKDERNAVSTEGYTTGIPGVALIGPDDDENMREPSATGVGRGMIATIDEDMQDVVDGVEAVLPGAIAVAGEEIAVAAAVVALASASAATSERPSDELNALLEDSHSEKLSQTKRPNHQTTPSTTPIPQTLHEALTTATTIRSYLGMQNNVTTTKLLGKSTKIQTQYLPKPQKTDAPMLNYIFDSFSTANKHHHHDQRYGPHFEDIVTDGNVTNITIQAGSSVYLNCRISLLQDKTVSWVKRIVSGDGENPLQLLTVGLHTYSGDNRYTMEFQYPNNWRLKIGRAQKSDEGTYECQISTHPPRVIQVNLHVNAPQVMIVDEYGALLQEKYYKIDSTLQLSCIVRNVVMSSSAVYWSHGEEVLNYDTTRGGVSVKTELMENGANSTLSIARINKADSGNYTCSINSSQEYSITVHILNGESFAELHHGSCSRVIAHTSSLLCIFIILITMHHIQLYGR